jgi:hypothetical protein
MLARALASQLSFSSFATFDVARLRDLWMWLQLLRPRHRHLVIMIFIVARNSLADLCVDIDHPCLTSARWTADASPPRKYFSPTPPTPRRQEISRRHLVADTSPPGNFEPPPTSTPTPRRRHLSTRNFSPTSSNASVLGGGESWGDGLELGQLQLSASLSLSLSASLSLPPPLPPTSAKLVEDKRCCRSPARTYFFRRGASCIHSSMHHTPPHTHPPPDTARYSAP